MFHSFFWPVVLKTQRCEACLPNRKNSVVTQSSVCLRSKCAEGFFLAQLWRERNHLYWQISRIWQLLPQFMCTQSTMTPHWVSLHSQRLQCLPSCPLTFAFMSTLLSAVSPYFHLMKVMVTKWQCLFFWHFWFSKKQNKKLSPSKQKYILVLGVYILALKLAHINGNKTHSSFGYASNASLEALVFLSAYLRVSFLF